MFRRQDARRLLEMTTLTPNIRIAIIIGIIKPDRDRGLIGG